MTTPITGANARIATPPTASYDHAPMTPEDASAISREADATIYDPDSGDALSDDPYAAMRTAASSDPALGAVTPLNRLHQALIPYTGDWTEAQGIVQEFVQEAETAFSPEDYATFLSTLGTGSTSIDEIAARLYEAHEQRAAMNGEVQITGGGAPQIADLESRAARTARTASALGPAIEKYTGDPNLAADILTRTVNSVPDSELEAFSQLYTSPDKIDALARSLVAGQPGTAASPEAATETAANPDYSLPRAVVLAGGATAIGGSALAIGANAARNRVLNSPELARSVQNLRRIAPIATVQQPLDAAVQRKVDALHAAGKHNEAEKVELAEVKRANRVRNQAVKNLNASTEPFSSQPDAPRRAITEEAPRRATSGSAPRASAAGPRRAVKPSAPARVASGTAARPAPVRLTTSQLDLARRSATEALEWIPRSSSLPANYAPHLTAEVMPALNRAATLGRFARGGALAAVAGTAALVGTALLTASGD